MAEHIIIPTTGHLQRAISDAERKTLRDLAQQAAIEDVEDGAEPEFFAVTASTNEVDSYGTFMAESTLANFAVDATFDGKAGTGVSVLDSHNGMRLGFGRSLTGESTGKAFRSAFFTVPGIQVPGAGTTDAYIAGLKRGLWFDISVGFWMPPEARITCTICGKDMWRWWGDDGDWHHFPGVEYEVEGDGETKRQIALGEVENGRLSEYSLVYDGATPGAGVAKARSMEDAGELDWRVAAMLERAYNTTFPRAMAGRTFSHGSPQERAKMTEVTPRDTEVETLVAEDVEPVPAVEHPPVADPVVETVAGVTDDDEETVIPEVTPAPEPVADPEPEDDFDDRMTPAFRARLNAELADTGITVGSRAGAAILTLGRKVSELVQQNRTLADQAADGVAYREELVKDTIAMAIRALPAGKTDPGLEDRYRRQLANSTIDDIKATRDERRAAALRQCPAGRGSDDGADDEPVQHRESLPDAAFVDVR
jgi:hypothetical protein